MFACRANPGLHHAWADGLHGLPIGRRQSLLKLAGLEPCPLAGILRKRSKTGQEGVPSLVEIEVTSNLG